MRKKPEKDDEELGIESYHIKRQQAVERAMEKVRGAMPEPWKSFSQNDMESMNVILGEVWAHSERAQWDAIVFSKMTLATAVKLVRLGDRVSHGELPPRNSYEKASALLADLK